MAEVSEKAFPFDAEEINGEYDRTYLADDFARYFRSFISSGVFMGESTNLQVIANGDMTVTLKVGAGIIDGYRYDNIEDIIIKLTPADGVLSRIDRISFTWSKEDRDIHYTVQEGSLSYNPVAPECRRTADYKDYVVADVYVGAGVVSISQTAITDQRFNNDVCGLANPFDEVDTTTLYNKLEAFYKEFEDRTEQWTAEQKAIVEEWYEGVKNTLDGDAAVNLQNQIGVLSSLTTVNKSNLVAALNELNAKEIDVLDTKEEIEANTSDGKVAGAKAVKDIYSSLGGLNFGTDGDGNVGYYGADGSLIPFKRPKKYLIKDGVIQNGLVFKGDNNVSAQSKTGYIQLCGNGLWITPIDISGYAYISGKFANISATSWGTYADTTNNGNRTHGKSVNPASYLADLKDNVYVGISIYASASQYFKVYDLWLE